MAMLEAAVPATSGVSGVGVVLEGVSWETYEKLVKGIGDGSVRVTYDNGLMEIEMSPSRKHESDADFLRSLVTMVCLKTGTAAAFGGSTTHHRKDLAKGLEPDGCYWIAHEKDIRGVAQLDLEKHPAPDLAIEVDLTSRSVDKIAIYTAIGVPEIWHITSKGELVFLVWSSDSTAYERTDSSVCLPAVKRQLVAEAMSRIASDGEIAALAGLLEKLGL